MAKIKLPVSGMGSMIPVPESELGRIEENSEEKFISFFGNMSFAKYTEYVEQCKNQGFDFDSIQTEKKYAARDGEGYTLLLEYIGYDTIKIEVDQPQYNVSLTISCESNLLFSRYDVACYVDEEYQGTIQHGNFDSYQLVLAKGNHALRFVDREDSSITGGLKLSVNKDGPIEITISCSNSGIRASLVSDDSGEKNTDNAEMIPEATETESVPNETEPTEIESETSVNTVPVMAGVSLSAVVAKSAEYGVSKQLFTDEDWGHGTKMKTLTNTAQSISIDICYSTETSEVISAEIIPFLSATEQEQKDYICGMASVLCSPSDKDGVVGWVKANVGTSAKTTINGRTYELSLGTVNNYIFSAGIQEWETWELQFDE